MAVVALLSVFLLRSVSTAGEKSENTLANSLQEADLIFTGKIKKVDPLGRSNSVPPSTFGNITFADTKALRGAVTEGKFNYTYREGKRNFDLEAKGEVLVAIKNTRVLAIVPATESNLGVAKKIIDAKLP